MLKLRKIAVTGAVASGKSLVCRLFREEGAYCCSADEIVHQLIASNSYCISQLLQLFGPDIASNGLIQRDKIAQIVFADSKKRLKLEQLIHPLALQEIETAYASASADGSYSLFVAEVPLLYEAGWEKYFDEIVAVIAPLALCKERYLASGHTGADFDARMQAQLSPEEKKQKAHHIIRNEAGVESLREAVHLILSRGDNGQRKRP